MGLNMSPTAEGIQRLKELYGRVSKHSHYQIMPDFLADLVDPVALNKRYSRYEVERMEYFQKHVPFQGARVVDVGANTGYFSFASAQAGAAEVVAYEGNREHAEFLRTAAEIYHKPVRVLEEYMDFSGPLPGSPFDIILLLNVLHHVGDDFGDQSLTIDRARREIIKNLNHLADKTKHLILQIGFSWKTNYDFPLFAHGTKGEMIEMFREGVRGTWVIEAIGIAREEDGRTIYRELSAENIMREDRLGEFRNRPIFILKSLRC
ncbi:MAG: methyltransferase domain-containing protein [Flavobacteriales bacterium]|jgi:SAM-dependent methyltransferase|nr:MAG: methyltransferase domain-containing protein [Flavobacteriales bacterium]